MSKVDLNLYLAQMKDAYESAKEGLLTTNEAYNINMATEEDCLQSLKDFEQAKAVYETAIICTNLLNKPSKKHGDDYLKSWYNNTTDKWLKASLYDENINAVQSIINKFKEIK